MTNVHVHAPKATAKFIQTCVCPDCGKRTRMLQIFTPWYGITSTCIKCGMQWTDGWRIPLELSRFARQANIDYAKMVWRAMPPISQNHFDL